jgi:predicted nucleic acid-binding protein
MGQRYLIDTNVLIDFFNGRLPEDAKSLLFSIEPIISVITHIELFSSKNASEAELLQLKSFVKSATVYNYLTPEIVNKTIDIRLQTNLKTPDAIIAATALANGLVILSRNVKDFDRVKGLEIANPYAL